MSRLDLKYRPRKFSEVVGNDWVIRLLLKRSEAGSLTDQSMMFGGPKGTGKTTLARIVAMAIVCQNKDHGEPCGLCDACLAVVNGTSTYVEELDAASQGTVSKIRSMVEDSAYETMYGTPNVYILDEAQRLSSAAQDAILKAIEDRSIIVILCTTEPHHVKESIKSRVEEYPIRPPSVEAMTKKLTEICAAEQIAYSHEAIEMIAKAHRNCPRVCIRTIETMAALGDVNVDAAKDILKFDSYGAVNKILATIDDNPPFAVKLFDEIVDKEGAAWMADAIIFAISSALRMDARISHGYPCHLSFFQTRMKRWSEAAAAIGMMPSPNSDGILSVLLSFSQAAPVSAPILPSPTFMPAQTPASASASIQTPASASASIQTPASAFVQTPAPAPVQTPAPAQTSAPKVSIIEVDGVTFSSTEELTTLDKKIGGQVPSVEEKTEANVEYKPEKIPISDKEFSRGFTLRVRRT